MAAELNSMTPYQKFANAVVGRLNKGNEETHPRPWGLPALQKGTKADQGDIVRPYRQAEALGPVPLREEYDRAHDWLEAEYTSDRPRRLGLIAIITG